ncbi:MAG: polysaccharide deacetylase family protein [Endozoicomonas sp.]
MRLLETLAVKKIIKEIKFMPQPGCLTISLDFELYWGLRDKETIDSYKNNLLGVDTAIRAILDVFSKHGVHATWATVGFLFSEDKNSLIEYMPKEIPTYDDESLCPYKYINSTLELENKFHFASELIELIKEAEGQEIGTHTFSHYYCLEKGQTKEQFKHDLLSAILIARMKTVSLKTLVFPRNQWNQYYLEVLEECGIRCYRGNESCILYKGVNNERESQIIRALRLIDSYICLTGHHTYDYDSCKDGNLYNIPSSRFLRPYSNKLKNLEFLRMRRIKQAMSNAAKNGRIFHLWWHPHNFGTNTKENMAFLSRVLEHYSMLKEKYGMNTLNMNELTHKCR